MLIRKNVLIVLIILTLVTLAALGSFVYNEKNKNLKNLMAKKTEQTLQIKKDKTSKAEGLEVIEEAQEYEADSVAHGIVKEKTSSSVKVKFNQSSFSWTAVVEIDQNTLLKTIDKTSKEQDISLADIQTGDILLVKSKENITGESFVAVGIFRLK